jgi:hypothetical protein
MASVAAFVVTPSALRTVAPATLVSALQPAPGQHGAVHLPAAAAAAGAVAGLVGGFKRKAQRKSRAVVQLDNVMGSDG